MRSSEWKWLLAAGSFLMLTGLAQAQSNATSNLSGLKLSGDKPIQIESDKLEVHQNENVAIFTGNVNVVQGPTVLKAGKMLVYYAKPAGASGGSTEAPALTGSGNIDHLEVDGKVYIKSDDQIATGDKGTFDMKSEVLVLSGDKVVLSQGANILVGCRLTVQMKTGLAQVDGCTDGGSGSGRVMMSITPGSQQQDAQKP